MKLEKELEDSITDLLGKCDGDLERVKEIVLKRGSKTISGEEWPATEAEINEVFVLYELKHRQG